MSQVIDERIVQLALNSTGFTSEAKSTISVIDKLKNALDFSGVSKSFNIIGSAGGTAFQGLATGVLQVQNQFSALERFAIGFFERLGSQAAAAGERVVNALFLDPVKTGFSEYETQINAIQTILANTSSAGTTLDDVMKSLGELNDYADKTIYNFTEMTRNIGTFTAAGVDLETSTTAIKGIANLAAISGSTSEQASRAMYQISQALASGVVNLQDWNSIVNAGMGGKVFQDALVETAERMGKVVDLSKGFRSSISLKDGNGWLTTDVLLKTLEHFTDSVDEATLRAEGYTKKQIGNILKMSQTATDAATKVKTFTQLWDTMTEFAQSGWTQTWTYIIGDFEEAKEMLTSISKAFENLYAPTIEVRNAAFKFWHDMGGRDKMIEAVATAFENLRYNLKPIGNALKNAFPEFTGELLMRLTNQFAKFSESIRINPITFNRIQTGLEGILSLIGPIANAVRQFTKGLSTGLGLGEKVPGVLDFVLKKFSGLGKAIKSFTGDKNKLAKFGENFKSIGESVGIAVQNIIYDLKPLKYAFERVFGKEFKIQTKSLFEITTAIRNFANSLKLPRSKLGAIQRIFLAVFSTIRSGINIAKVAYDYFKRFAGVMSGPLKTAASIAENIFVDLSNKLIRFNNKLASTDDIYAFIEDKIAKAKAVFEKVKGYVVAVNNVFKESSGIDVIGTISTVWESIKTAASSIDLATFSTIVSTVTDIVINLAKNFLPSLVNIANAIGKIIGTLFSGIASATDSEANVAVSIVDIIGLILFGKGLSASKKAEDTLDTITNFVDTLKDIWGTLKTGILNITKSFEKTADAKLFEGIAKAILEVAIAVLILSIIDPVSLAFALSAVTQFFVELLGSIIALDKAGFSSSKDIVAVAGAIGVMASGVLQLSASVLILSLLDYGKMWSGIGAITTIMGALTGMIIAVSKVLKFGSTAQVFTKAAFGVILIGYAVKMFAKAITKIAKLDYGKMWSATGVIVAVLGAMTGFIVLTKDSKNVVKNAFGMILLSAAVLIVATALKMLADVDAGQMIKTVVILSSVMAIMAVITTSTKDAVSGASSLLMMSAALFIVSAALRMLADIDALQLVISAGVLVGVMFLMSLLAKLAGDSVVGAASLILMAGAVMIMAMALKLLSTIPMDALPVIGLALLAILGAMTLLMVVIALIGPYLTPVIPVMLAFAGSMFLLGIAALSFGAGMMLIVTAMLLFAANSALLLSTFTSFLTTIIQMIPLFVEMVTTAITLFLESLVQNVPIWGEALVTIICEVVTIVITAIPRILDSVWTALQPLIEKYGPIIGPWISEKLSALWGYFKDGWAMIWDGIKKKASEIWTSVKDFFKKKFEAIKKIFHDKIEEFKEIGKNIIQGIVDGLQWMWDNSLAGKITSIAGDMLSGFKSVLGIESPSKAFANAAKFIPAGIVSGIEKTEGQAFNSVESMSNGLLSAFGDPFSQIMHDFELYGDMNPTITPVLDLSSVRANAGQINGMFANQSLRLASINGRLNADAIKLREAQIQNSSYNDGNVLANIAGLRSDINTLGDRMEGMQIVMDTGALVGATVGSMDNALGQRAQRQRRGGR